MSQHFGDTRPSAEIVEDKLGFASCFIDILVQLLAERNLFLISMNPLYDSVIVTLIMENCTYFELNAINNKPTLLLFI